MRVVLVAVACILTVPAAAAAQRLSDAAKLIGGAAVGLALHESAHVVADLASGVAPGVKKVTFGPLPFFAITLLAGLQTISPDLHEAAALDGANAWYRF